MGELAPLLVILEEDPDEETLETERQLILAEPDPEKRADLLAIAATLASRIFDKEFLRRFFREELIQMEHATLIDEWLEEAVQEAVQETEIKAITQIRERVVKSIVRILSSRFMITELQKAKITASLTQIVDISQLDTVEEKALLAFSFAEFTAYLDERLLTKRTNGSLP